MIHSMSGGVLKENGEHTFVKVQSGEEIGWYLCPFSGVKEGDRVQVPEGKFGSKTGIVLKTERCSAQCSPVPMNRIREVERILSV